MMFFSNGEWGETAGDVDRMARAAHEAFLTRREVPVVVRRASQMVEVAKGIDSQTIRQPLGVFAGWKKSFFGDVHAHGKDAIAFYTEQKVVMTRWF
jgi:hypothetical protein